jgi:hypothetical protein
MAEMEVFERRVADGLRAYAGEMPSRVDAAAVADRVAGERARRPWRTATWGSGRLGLAWAAALVALLLVGLLAAAIFVGGWRPDQALVVVPSPTSPATAVEATILATTKAHPLPAQATCPPGSNPDVSGPANQERPAASGPMAFDRHAGRIVLAADDGTTWTFDVCTNVWQRMSPAQGSPSTARRLVYDADSDRTLALVEITETPTTTPFEIWSYDRSADHWTRDTGSFQWAEDGNPTYGTVFYHDPSGLVVIYNGTTMWAYDVDARTLTEIPQRPDPSLPAGSGLPEGRIAFGYDPARDLIVAVVVPYAGESDDCAHSNPCLPARWQVPVREWGETWTLDPGTGSWRKEEAPAASDLIVCGVMWRGSTECYPTAGRAVFDEVSGLTVFITRDYGRPANPGRVDAYNAGTDTWHTLFPATGSGGAGPYWCMGPPPVYDSLDGRIVCEADGGVSAFSTATGQWRWLLEP